MLRSTAVASMGVFTAIALAGCVDALPPQPLRTPPPSAGTTVELVAPPPAGPPPAAPSPAGECAAGGLDSAARIKLLKHLAEARDPSGAPCLIRVLEGYQPDVNEEEVRHAARAVEAMRLKEAAGPLLRAFVRLRHSRPKAFSIYRDVYDAVRALNDPSWEDSLIQLLDRPILDVKDVATLRDELFWQITAAELLGMQGSERAIEPILRMALTPSKSHGAATAILALVKIGPAAGRVVTELLEGKRPELARYSIEEQLRAAGDAPTQEQKTDAQSAHVRTAALILGTLGRPESAAALLDALRRERDPVVRTAIARELTKVPRTPETVKAFQETYEKAPPDLTIPPGYGAREALLEAATSLFDAALVPWIVKTALAARGDEDDLAPIREASLIAALKLMTPAQLAEVDRLYRKPQPGPNGRMSTVGAELEREYRMTRELLAACGDRFACYLAKAADPAAQTKENQFTSIKAAYMLGVLGTPALRPKIVEAMPHLTHAGTRFVAVVALDALSPQGDPALADQLQAIVDQAEAARDLQMISSNAPFKTVIYRLRARAR